MRLFSTLSRLFSSSDNSKKTVVGAFAGSDALNTYTETLSWLSDVQDKLPSGTEYSVTPTFRETSYNTDPMLSGTIILFLKNIILGSSHIETKDNKKYESLVTEIQQYLASIDLMDAFRADFKDYAIVHGHSYRRKDYDINKQLEKLQKLDTSSITMYTDPWDSNIVAYHQQIYINTSWSSVATSEEYNSWFIPGGKLYIEDGPAENGAKEIFDEVAEKYGITDVTNLRVDSADKIIAMHRVAYGDPAPIDNVVLAIWLKRLLLTNSPNIIFRVLSPFIHVKNGVLVEATIDGDKQLISSIPSEPPAAMATTDPEQYTAMNTAYNNWVTGCKNVVTTILDCLKEGGVFSSGPDTELNVIESGRTVPSEFIQTMINILDEDIGNAFGFPVSLIRARGAELATTRTIQDIFNTTYAGVRRDYQRIADALIKERFEGTTWDYEITTKDGQTEKGTFTFDEAAPKFILDTGDVKDALKMAQTRLQHAKKLNELKNLGASRSDIQAIAEEDGFGTLDLDKFDEQQMPFPPFGQSIQSTKGDLKPSESDEEQLKEDLLKAYKDAQKAVGDLI